MTPLQQIIDACRFAAEKHRLQRRKSEPEQVSSDRSRLTPYINHPIAVMDTIAQIGNISDPVVLCAAVLHDTIEDTDTTEAELRAHFGDAITNVVLEVSDDKLLPKQERKRLQIEHAAHASTEARLVKLGDKINNVQDLLLRPPRNWDVERVRTYFDWAKAVIDQVRGTNAALERTFDDMYAKKP